MKPLTPQEIDLVTQKLTKDLIANIAELVAVASLDERKLVACHWMLNEVINALQVQRLRVEQAMKSQAERVDG